MPLLTPADWTAIRSLRTRSVSEWATALGTSTEALESLSRGSGPVEVATLPPDAASAVAMAMQGRVRREGRALLDDALSGLVAPPDDERSTDPAAILTEVAVRLTRIVGGPRVVARLLDERIWTGSKEERAAMAEFRRKA